MQLAQVGLHHGLTWEVLANAQWKQMSPRSGPLPDSSTDVLDTIPGQPIIGRNWHWRHEQPLPLGEGRRDETQHQPDPYHTRWQLAKA